jgi:purine-binding chemotaxis protein CheW
VTPRASTLLSVRISGALLGLPVADVREIVRAVAITSLPAAPAMLEGVVNVRGTPVPVVNLRRRLGLPPRALDADEFLVLVAAGARLVAVRVDEVEDLVEVGASELSASSDLSPALQGMSGLAALPGGMIVIYDPAAFVSQAEGEAIDAALATA